MLDFDGETYKIHKYICPSCGSGNVDGERLLYADYKSMKCFDCGISYEVSDIDDDISLKGLTLVSSNNKKLEEYQRFGLEGLTIEKGRDLREVLGTPEEVVIYKALEAGPGRIIEDTSLQDEDGVIGVNAKWLKGMYDELDGKRAVFLVYLAVNFGKSIALFKGEVVGEIVKAPPVPDGERVFGFDNNFVPYGCGKTLHELIREGQKDRYNARKKAAEMLMAASPSKTVSVSDIPEWSGPYQGE